MADRIQITIGQDIGTRPGMCAPPDGDDNAAIQAGLYRDRRAGLAAVAAQPW